MLAPLFVVPRALCCAPQAPPDPLAGTQLVWPRVVACWATGQAQAGDMLSSFESRPHTWALKGWLRGLFDLYYRTILKTFTSILNGHVYFSPPVANSNRQVMFHPFAELQGVIHSKHFWFYAMEKSKHFLRCNFSDLFLVFIDQILPNMFLFYSMDTTESRKIILL